MASSQTLPSLLLATLLVLASTGTVTLSDSSSVTVSGPLTKSLSSSYSLADGYTWNRQRSGSYNKFAEYYTLSVQSSCAIKCGPYSWPVISAGRLYCERDLSYFSKNQPFTGNAYKALCIPDISTGSGFCLLATYTMYSTSASGSCSYGLASGNSFYSSNSGNFDCCHNNNNPSESYQFNEYSDQGATIHP